MSLGQEAEAEALQLRQQERQLPRASHLLRPHRPLLAPLRLTTGNAADLVIKVREKRHDLCEKGHGDLIYSY